MIKAIAHTLLVISLALLFLHIYGIPLIATTVTGASLAAWNTWRTKT